MNEQEIYAYIGKKQVELDIAKTALSDNDKQYSNLLLTLSRVASGELAPDRVTVNMTAKSWAVNPGAPVAPKVPVKRKKKPKVELTQAKPE